MEQTLFEKKIKPILLYVGTIGAIAMSIGYLILMFVLVLGFNAQVKLMQTIVFAIINAIVGFIIMQFLKVQGISFAKDLDANKAIIEEYADATPKKNKTHSIKWYWVKSVSTDLLVKALSVGIATAGIIYIVVQGSHDYNLILLSVVNLIMFACFGLLSLVKAYDFFNEMYIPYMKDKINERKEREAQLKATDCQNLEVAEKKSDKQGNDPLRSCGGIDILDTSVDTCNNCIDNQSVVVDSNDNSDNLLGRTIHTSSGVADSIHNPTQEVTRENKA